MKRWLILLAILVSLLAIGTTLVVVLDAGEVLFGIHLGKDAAYEACREKVTEQLKAPATAVFPPRDKIDVIEFEKGMRVMGFVDAQNGFGALIRMRYECNTERTGRFSQRAYDVDFVDRDNP